MHSDFVLKITAQGQLLSASPGMGPAGSRCPDITWGRGHFSSVAFLSLARAPHLTVRQTSDVPMSTDRLLNASSEFLEAVGVIKTQESVRNDQEEQSGAAQGGAVMKCNLGP